MKVKCVRSFPHSPILSHVTLQAVIVKDYISEINPPPSPRWTIHITGTLWPSCWDVESILSVSMKPGLCTSFEMFRTTENNHFIHQGESCLGWWLNRYNDLNSILSGTSLECSHSWWRRRRIIMIIYCLIHIVEVAQFKSKSFVLSYFYWTQ